MFMCMCIYCTCMHALYRPVLHLYTSIYHISQMGLRRLQTSFNSQFCRQSVFLTALWRIQANLVFSHSYECTCLENCLNFRYPPSLFIATYIFLQAVRISKAAGNKWKVKIYRKPFTLHLPFSRQTIFSHHKTCKISPVNIRMGWTVNLSECLYWKQFTSKEKKMCSSTGKSMRDKTRKRRYMEVCPKHTPELTARRTLSIFGTTH